MEVGKLMKYSIKERPKMPQIEVGSVVKTLNFLFLICKTNERNECMAIDLERGRIHRYFRDIEEVRDEFYSDYVFSSEQVELILHEI